MNLADITPELIASYENHTKTRYYAIWQHYMGAYELGLLPTNSATSSQILVAPQPTIVYSKLRYLGRYAAPRLHPKLIPAQLYINLAYHIIMQDNESLDNTIAHELAHHLQWKLCPQFKHWHGPEFRQIMRAIGQDPSATIEVPYGIYEKLPAVEQKVQELQWLTLL